MDAQLEAKLIDCLDALAQGQSVEKALARFPDDAAQLRPMLETVQALPAFRMQPSEAAKIKSRQNFLAQADLLRRSSPRRTAGFLPRFVTGFVAATILAVVLGAGAVAASGSALPGDPLYGLKRAAENVQLSTAASASALQELQQEFDQRRLTEVNQLLAAGRESEVEFTGLIENLQPKAWIVGGLVVQVNADTQIAGTPQLDRLAEVHGMTGSHGLTATAIAIEPSNPIDVTPIPVVQPTLRATDTPEPTRTPVVTPRQSTPMPQLTATPQPSATPRPTATRTPQPTATSEPVEVDFEGVVNAQSPDTWNIDGIAVTVNGNTEIRGSISVGQRVKVKASRQADGRLIATRIELVDSGGGGGQSGGNANENQNQNEGQNSNDNSNSHDDGGGSNSNDNNTNSNDGGSSSNSNDDHSNSNDGLSGSNSNDDHSGSGTDH